MSTNYGQARFMIGSQIAGNVRVTAVTHAPALAPRIRIHLAWSIGHLLQQGARDAPPLPYRIVGVEGELRLGEMNPAVGVLFQLGERNALRSLPYVGEQQMELIIDLDWFRFERLEEHRQGGPLEVWLKIWPIVQAEGEALDASVESFRVNIPREDWLGVIASITKDRTDLLEVRYHLTYAAAFGPSLKELAGARSAVDRGDPSGAVIRARKALLLAEEASRASGEKTLQSLLGGHVDERHAKIYAGVVAKVKEMGNIQAHAVTTRSYSRSEALFAIRTAENLLELLGSILGD